MKAALPLSLLAAVTLAGCATDPQSTSGLDNRPKIAAKEMPYKAGTGVVQSWSATPASAAAGASGRVDPVPGTGMIRMAVKMEDGSVQYIDTDSRDFPVGTRIELTQDRMIERR